MTSGFQGIYGQDRVIRTLENEIEKNRVSHAYLFSGAEGIGKFTTARYFARALLCKEVYNGCGVCADCQKAEHYNHPNIYYLQEEEGAKTIKIKQVRQLHNELKYTTLEDNYRIIIINNMNKMTTEGQNSLLKSIEEPRGKDIFILITSNINEVLKTIQSRCQSISFNALNSQIVLKILKEQGYGEELKIIANEKLSSTEEAKWYLEEKNQEIYLNTLKKLKEVLSGNLIAAFELAETLSKEKKVIDRLVSRLIQWFYLINEENVQTGHDMEELYFYYKNRLDREKTYSIIERLFELSSRLKYNVNLRLQLERTLMLIQEDNTL
jgi:DNA polymerase-3 subunit delta'